MYNGALQTEVATFGYDANANEIDLNGSSANMLLESLGFSPTQISQLGASLAATGGWDLSDPVQAAMREALIEASLAGNTTSMGTVQTAVYDANGSYLGQFGGSGGYTIYDQNGGVDSSGVMTDDGVTLADQELAGQLLTFSYDQPIPTSAYTNLRQINQALSAYLIASDNSDPLANAVDISDSNGNYYGNVGIDQTTGQMAIEAQGGSVVDISAALLAQYGLSASAVESAQQLWAPAGSLTESQATELSTTTTDLGALLQQYSDNPFENMTPAQIAQMSVSELSGFSAGQIYTNSSGR